MQIHGAFNQFGHYCLLNAAIQCFSTPENHQRTVVKIVLRNISFLKQSFLLNITDFNQTTAEQNYHSFVFFWWRDLPASLEYRDIGAEGIEHLRGRHCSPKLSAVHAWQTCLYVFDFRANCKKKPKETKHSLTRQLQEKQKARQHTASVSQKPLPIIVTITLRGNDVYVPVSGGKF